MKIDFDFACQDDCLDKMVPSDLRALISERDQLKDDQRLSDDPLTALAAVMRHHKMEFKVDATGSGLFEPSFSVDCADKYDDLFSIDGFLTLTADDIKPEK